MYCCNINLFQRENYRQLIAVLIINMATVTCSILISWLSPAIPQLMGPNPPVGTEPMTVIQISWIGSVIPLFGLVMLLLAAWSAEVFGRKITGCMIAVPALLSWIITYFAQNFIQLLIARILAAFVIGLLYSLVPVYVNEIADKAVRGQLGSVMTFANNIGTLIAYIMGAALSFHTFALCGLVAPAIFLALFVFMPEAPTYLIRKGHIQKAFRSLMWLRNGNKTIVDREMTELRDVIAKVSRQRKAATFVALFRNRGYTKGFLIALTLFCSQQLSGLSIVEGYTNLIFERANVTISSYISAIIVAMTQIIGSFLSTTTIDRVGRRPLLITSCSAMMVCHATLGVFFVLQHLKYNLVSFSWIPVIALSALVFTYSTGLGACSHVVVTEVLSPDIASLGVSIAMCAAFICSFITTNLFLVIVDQFGFHTAFFILAAICGTIVCIIYFLVPETKGKSMATILHELNVGKSYGTIICQSETTNIRANIPMSVLHQSEKVREVAV